MHFSDWLINSLQEGLFKDPIQQEIADKIKKAIIENSSNITNILRKWIRLGRNPIELVVLEPLGGVPELNLDQNEKLKNKNKTNT